MIFIILLVEFAAYKRLWCLYICPQAFLLVVAKLVNPVRLNVGFEDGKCICKKGRDPCEQACSLSLDPKLLGNSMETECNNCGDCIVACKKMGQALSFQFRSSKVKAESSK